MASRGFLIRFIDIGLIVLFGFLMISEIEASSRVDLAGAAEEADVLEPPREEDEDRGVVVVEITAAGRFVVFDPSTRDDETAAGVVAAVAGSTDELTAELRARREVHRAAGLETVVLIEPDPASLVQFTVNAMDACDRLDLPKSLRMDIDIEPSADPGVGDVR